VLWNGGISFGGVISFIFADLIILPILNIYRKYYGGRTSLYLLGVSYIAMALAGFLIGGAFQLLGLAPTNHHVAVFETQPTWNYTTFLNIAFLVLMAVLAWRFVTTGGIEMLRAHGRRPEPGAELVRDPVCGMSVSAATSSEKAEYAEATYYFCSAGCRSAFEKDPARYVMQPVAAGHAHSRAMLGGEMESKPRSAIDPVCGMSVDTDTAEYRSIQKGDTYYFCSAGCKAAFDRDPDKYMRDKET
jgi:YHS domain-containing protein